MADAKKIVVVTGATGAQGGSVVKFLLKDGKYAVRGLTRKVDAPAAQELKKLGVEVVAGDLNDVKSLEKAFHGAHGVFGVTNFWEGMSKENEIKQGKHLADAAKAAGVKHFVWSTLDHCDVPHFDGKAVVGDYCTTIGLPTTHLLTAFYYENFFRVMPPQKDPATGNQVWHFSLPADKQLFAYAVEDTGAFVVEAFNHPDKWINKQMKIASEFITPTQLNEVAKRICGPKFGFNHVDLEWFRKSGMPGAEELYLNMKHFINNQEPSGIRDVKLTHAIYPGAHTWESYLKTHEAEWKKLL